MVTYTSICLNYFETILFNFLSPLSNPDLKHVSIDKLQSSYNLHFSGLDTINRHEGLGSEFVLVKNEMNKQPMSLLF